MVRYKGHDPEQDWPGQIVAENDTTIYAGPFSFRALRGKNDAEAEANARLITAAPELLASLKALLERSIPRTPHWKDDPEIVAARAAIAKAVA